MSKTSFTVQTPAEYDSHRTARHAGAVASRGPASFVWGDFVTTPGARVFGATGEWEPLSAGSAGLRVRATAADGVVLGGHTVDGEGTLFLDPHDGPTVAHFPDGAEGVIFTYDHTKYALQVWNPRSDWASRFAEIESYPWSADWVVPAVVTPVTGERTVTITHQRDPAPVDVQVVAQIDFGIGDVAHRLIATPAGPGDPSLFIHFTDETTGSESYGSGRGIRFVPADDGTAVLDFNYATLLPCSFSLAWNCPLPPAENALPFAVRAGERHAVDATGAPLL